MSDLSRTRFVAIVPSQGSAYYLLEGGALIQVPLDSEGSAFIIGPDGLDPQDGGAVVDWDYAFESPAQAEPVRQVERTLRCLPADATAPGADPVLVSRSDLSDLLAAIGSARVRAADAYIAEGRTWKRVGEHDAGDEQEYFGRRMKHSGDQLLRAAGAISVTGNPLADLADLMPNVRWRDTDSIQP
jgi:hypothetical protein